MTTRVHTTTLPTVTTSIATRQQLADQFEGEWDDIGQAIVLHDADNDEAWVMVGDHDALERFAIAILSAIKRKPTVLVVENPNEDPTVLLHGPIDSFYESSFLSSQYVNRDDYEPDFADYYGGYYRGEADRLDRRGAVHLAEKYRDLADAFDARWKHAE